MQQYVTGFCGVLRSVTYCSTRWKKEFVNQEDAFARPRPKIQMPKAAKSAAVFAMLTILTAITANSATFTKAPSSAFHEAVLQD
jgi:hypothetical protein